MPANEKGIPEGFHSVTPSLVCADINAALEFYKNAFGAREHSRFPGPDGRIMHAEIEIGDSIVMLGTEAPNRSKGRTARNLGGFNCQLHIYVPDVDAAFNRAVQAGARVNQPLEDMFWGDRYGQLEDPDGNIWSIATQKEKLNPQQMQERAKEFFARMKQSAA